MLKKYYLAIDIGASSGRCMLGSFNNQYIELEEIHRFKNELTEVGGSLCWDLNLLFDEIIRGLKKCKELNKIPSKLSIDTWGVDFVLLNKKNEVIDKMYAYRDHRTDKSYFEVLKKLNIRDIYKVTGIQTQKFNTIFQLMDTKCNNPSALEEAEDFLMIPDYFNFLLTGKKFNEYTNATTTQLLNAKEKAWDSSLLDKLEYPRKIFKEVLLPGTSIGSVKESIKEELGYDIEVIVGASHDTASAVVSVPTEQKEFIYISSGTWSLVGTELYTPNCSIGSCEDNFTNEGGYGGTYRYLKNVMGLWIIQEYAKEVGTDDFQELCQLAKTNRKFKSRINVDDKRFLSPESMKKEIIKYCNESNQMTPSTVGEFCNLIYQSLSDSYLQVIKEVEKQMKTTYESIYVVGGGSSASYLNELIAEKTNKSVLAGPKEATAIGNIVVQMIQDKSLSGLSEARSSIQKSFRIEKYEGGSLWK